jgi:UDP-N-acetylglucosamine:LPS N-acetylglucosamine transferase
MTMPVVAAIDMGYGHLRPAAALADELGTQVACMDAPPLGGPEDRAFWVRVRALYEPLTRLSQIRFVGLPARGALRLLTRIPPLTADGDLSGPTQGTRWMARAAASGVGRQLASYLAATGAPLLATFYAAAVLAEIHGARGLHCVVTDSDVNRVWAPPESRSTRITYFTPADETRRRLLAYGVPKDRVHVTGYPLPGALVGRTRTELERNLSARVERLAGKGAPPLIAFTIGGAGAQVPLATRIIAGIERPLRDGSLRLGLVAGRRPEVAGALQRALAARGLSGHPSVELVFDPDFFAYLRRFNALLARTDALWSKPSELVFFAALGLPFISAPPVGMHEVANLRWGSERGAALTQADPARCGEWLLRWLREGTLAKAAEAGMRLPQAGVYEIADAMRAA